MFVKERTGKRVLLQLGRENKTLSFGRNVGRIILCDCPHLFQFGTLVPKTGFCVTSSVCLGCPYVLDALLLLIAEGTKGRATTAILRFHLRQTQNLVQCMSGHCDTF